MESAGGTALLDNFSALNDPRQQAKFELISCSPDRWATPGLGRGDR
jgi:hypothetical protein